MKSIVLYLCLLASFNHIEALTGQEALSSTWFPYHVSIRDSNGDFICSGCLVNHEWVLTAAHCVDNADWNHVILGTRYFDGSGGVVKQINNVITYPGYSSTNPEIDDIALVQIDYVAYSSNIKRMIIPNYSIIPGTKLVATGWGPSSTKGPIWPILRYFVTRTIPLNVCQTSLSPINIQVKDLCTRSNTGKAMCTTDDGGPLVDYNNKRVHGIMSRNQMNCAAGIIDVNIYVAQYMVWILSII